MKKRSKRFVSIVLAVAMILTMVPFSAFADETTASDNAETTNAIGGTIEKVADTAEWYSDATKEFMTRTTFWNDQVSEQPETYTVDENSKTISIGSAEALVWWAKQVNIGTSFADYTINITANIDLSAHYWTPICTGTVSYTTGGKYSIENNSTLDRTTINGNGYTITGLATQTGVRGPNQDSKPGDGQNCYYDAAFIGYSCCNITINNLTFDGARIAISEPFDQVTQTYGSSMMAVIVGAQTGGSLTLNNVTVNNADVLAMQKAAAFVANLMGNSTLTVNNCAITNSRFSAYFMVAPISSYSKAEQVTIKGIKLENNHVRMIDQSWPEGYYQYPNNGAWYLDYGDSVDINACTTAMFYDGTNAAITNGTLSGTGVAWTPVASIDDYMYSSLEDALDAAKDGDTIKLLEDVTVSSPISTKKALSFEGVTKADGTKPVIRSAGGNGLFSQSGDAVYTIKNLTLETSLDGQWYIYHSANTLTIENCDFVMAEAVSNTGNVVMGEGSPSTDEDYALIFKNNTITANSRAALTGVGNNSIITKNIIDLVNEKHGNTDARTSMIALTAVAGKGTVTISENTFKNANRAIAVDNSSLSASDLTIKNNQFINVRFAFELSPTKNVNQGTFDLSKNYYNFNDTVSALKVQDADSEGDKFNFGEGSSEYLPEGTNLVITEPYYTAPTMKDEDLNTYVPPSTGGGTVTPTPTPDPEPEEPSDSEDTVTNPDGSTTTTITKEDGSSSTTTVGTDGKVESEVTVSEEAISNADGAAVALPIPEVPVTTDKASAPTVTVNLPSKDATKVEVPVKDVTPGTVAVLVDADGNETVIKDTVQSENGITVELTDGATIKIVDNSKSFDDVTSDYWGASAINFATSRELFAGTGESEFSPEGQMTRAMIWSVLARYEGADTKGASGSDWYAGPQQWAIENGISDGTMANSAMTREQLAAMLYRYVGSPAVEDTVGNYTDADSISSWASDAMRWAVQKGLIAGMGENTLNPQGTATRTQVAAILQRFIENKMA